MKKHFHFRLLTALYGAAIVCFAGAGICALLSNSMQDNADSERYAQYFNAGQYADALRIDHTNRDGIYTKLINSFTEDEKLDTEEDNFIINEIKARSDLAPTDSDYGRIMYEIGNAYWLYYDPHTEGAALNENELEKNRITVSYEWFEKAVGNETFAAAEPDAYARAVIFYNIGQFYIEIDRKEREGTDDRQFYLNMWDSIQKLSAYADDPNEVISARVCQTLCTLISRYSPKFRLVGTKQSAQEAILDKISAKLYKNGAISYTNTYSVGIAEQIDVDAVRLKLSMAYADKGGTRMTPEQLHKLAVILLVAGILILIAAIVFSVRFGLISLLRTELNSRKTANQTEQQDYFESVRKKEIESIPAEVQPAPVSGRTVPAKRQQPEPEPPHAAETVLKHSKPADTRRSERTGTVLAGQGKRRQDHTGSGTLVVSARRRNAAQEPEFLITDQIIVMGGDPAAVSQCRNTTQRGF